MKKRLLSIILLLAVVLLPFNVSAKDFTIAGKKYKVNDYLTTLQEEGITPSVPDYKEDSNKINIYLFTGKGCEHCATALNFLNDIGPEYSQYFNLISFEIYGDKDNARLLKDIAQLIGVEDDGVPFMFVGDKYFNGYTDEYNETIKQAITDTYNTEYTQRTDIMKSYEKEIGYNGVNSNSVLSDGAKIILFNLCFTLVSTIIIIVFVNNKINSLDIKKKKQDK